MTLSYSEFNPMLKEYYTPRRVELLAYKDHPLLAMVPKQEDWGGRDGSGTGYIIPIWHGSAQATGANFTVALANKGQGQYDRFEMSKKTRYGFAQLDRMTMKASMKSPTAFLKAFSAEVDGIKSQLGRDTARSLYRQGRGHIGTVGSEAGAVITLSNRADIVNFELGMVVVFSDAGSAVGAAEAGASAWATASNRYTVDAVNRSAGTVTFTGQTPAATSGVAAGDFLHRYGDITVAGTYIDIEGLEAHFPETAPTSGDSFQGVDRSADTDRLAGVRVDASALTIEEGLIDAGTRLREMGKRPDRIFMNPVRFGQLVKEMSGRIIHDKVKAPGAASLGFKTIKAFTPAGDIDVVSDPDCPHDVAWMLTMNTLKLATTGAYPQIADEDSVMLRSATADEYEVRLAAYGNLGCHDPGANARIALA